MFRKVNKKPTVKKTSITEKDLLETEESDETTKRERDESEHDTDLAEASIKERLEIAKERVNARKKKKGLHIAGYSQAEDQTAVKVDDTVEGFSGQFTQESTGNEVDKLMEKYVEEKLREKRKKQEGDQYGLVSYDEALEKKRIEEEFERNTSLNKLTPLELQKRKIDEELYRVPDHLKTKRKKEIREEDALSAMAAGIQEVELPSQYRLKNIEETEKARMEFEQKQRGGGGDTERKPKTAPHFFRKQYDTDASRPDQATDDLAMMKFKRRTRF